MATSLIFLRFGMLSCLGCKLAAIAQDRNFHLAVTSLWLCRVMEPGGRHTHADVNGG
jgi:hypothetical protein